MKLSFSRLGASAAALGLLLTGLSSPVPAHGAPVAQVFLPAVFTAPPAPLAITCQTIPGTSYSAIPIASAPTNIPAAQHPDLNLQIRGWVATSGTLGLVKYPPGSNPPDASAPQLAGLFVDHRVPTISGVYQVNDWNWTTNSVGSPITTWPVTLAGMAVTPGEVIQLPRSGYSIYQSSYQAMVLYATSQQITLKYTRDDNVVYGYTVHVEGVCVEPSLLSLYNQMNAAGRAQLPALIPGQPFGRANGNEIQVSIRDSGSFMDPRSQTDWWQGFSSASYPTLSRP